MKRVIIFLILVSGVFITISQTIILDEDFEGYTNLPPGWDEITTSSGNQWEVSPVNNSHYLVIPYHSTMVSLNEGDYDKTYPSEFLVTPTLDLSDFSSAFLSMDVFFKAMTHLNSTEEASIEASTDGGNTWMTVMNIEGYFNWHRIYSDASDYCGFQSVKFAIKYKDNGGWLYGIGIDNFKVFIPFEHDVAMQSIKKYDFVVLNDTVTLDGAIQNLGTTNINSIDINWNVNEENIQTENYSSLNLSPLDTFHFNHSIPWIPTTQELFYVKIWVSNFNGISDNNPYNDTLSMQVINALSSKPEKNVLLEVFGANWCTICPHAASTIGEIKDSTDNLIVAVNHIDDPFSCNIGLEIFENYHLFPGWLVTGLIDRYDYSADVSMDMDRYLWPPHHVYQREEHNTPVELNLSNNYNSITRDLDIFLTATFKCDLSGDFRFNCYVVEDSLVEEQANCLTIEGREPYCFAEYWVYDPPGIIQNYIHMNVLRDVLGGPWGTIASLPGFVEDGNTYEFQYEYTVPDEFKENNLKIIGMVQQYDPDSSKCQVLNVGVMYLDGYTSSEKINYNNAEFLIYPIPADDYMIIEATKFKEDFWIGIRNIYGKGVLTRNAKNSIEYIDTSELSSGIYILTIGYNGKTLSKKVVIL